MSISTELPACSAQIAAFLNQSLLSPTRISVISEQVMTDSDKFSEYRSIYQQLRHKNRILSVSY